jgi:hypothetical protein
MKSIIPALVLLPAIAIVGCRGGDSDDELRAADQGEEFVLPYGKTIDVGPLTLEFVAVIEESRCPINAVCVALSPNAQIQLAATSPGHAEILELNTTRHPAFALFDGHLIELLSLDPLPSYPYPTPSAETYRARLIVDRQIVISGR